MDPDMYMCRVDIFPLLFLIFSFLITSQKDFIIPYIIDNRMTDSPHHHSIMYYFTPYILLFIPYSPVICKDFSPFIYMYKSIY